MRSSRQSSLTHRPHLVKLTGDCRSVTAALANLRGGTVPVVAIGGWHEVRCCSDVNLQGFSNSRCNDVWAASDVSGCHSSKSFSVAESICQNAGARLCAPWRSSKATVPGKGAHRGAASTASSSGQATTHQPRERGGATALGGASPCSGAREGAGGPRPSSACELKPASRGWFCLGPSAGVLASLPVSRSSYSLARSLGFSLVAWCCPH